MARSAAGSSRPDRLALAAPPSRAVRSTGPTRQDRRMTPTRATTTRPCAPATRPMPYRRCGRSGLELPAVSLGLWHNFGDDRPLDDQRAIAAPRLRPRRHPLRPGQQLRPAVRLGREQLRPHPRARTSRRYRDELIISTKAGYDMWPGPVRRVGLAQVPARVASTSRCERMGLDYVDIFYSHRFDPDTPLEETMGALDTAVRAGQGALRRHLVVLGASGPARRPRSCASSARRC